MTLPISERQQQMSCHRNQDMNVARIRTSQLHPTKVAIWGAPITLTQSASQTATPRGSCCTKLSDCDGNAGVTWSISVCCRRLMRRCKTSLSTRVCTYLPTRLSKYIPMCSSSHKLVMNSSRNIFLNNCFPEVTFRDCIQYISQMSPLQDSAVSHDTQLRLA